MKTRLILLSVSLLASVVAKSQSGYPYTQVPFTAVKMTPGTFWGQRIQAARDVTIPLAFSKCESEHRYKNFEMAAYTLRHPGHAGLQTDEWDVSKFMGFSFDDTDVYKTIEGASFVLQTYPDKKLMAYIDSVLDLVAAAQEPDGYLYTARTINPKKPHGWSGDTRWSKEEVLSHELYNLGHMVDAACAHYQATRSSKFLNIVKRYADCVIREVGPAEGQATVVPGHQIAEMALARLYVLTGDKRYLEEAKFFLDYRGKTKIHDIYSQSDKPILEQTEAWGHAVRAGYMYAGIADVAALTGDSDYIHTIDRIWENIISRKYYITGGVGARHRGESFGADYELPNLTSYNETCAAISMVYLFQRMFLLHGESKYIDCLERTLYNGVISGMSVDGGKFFYPNPLSADGKYKFNADNTNTRQPWFGCACCPSNLCRFIPSVPGYVYGIRDRSLYVNLFTGNTASVKLGGKDVVLEQVTEYPWNGDVTIRIQKNKAGRFALKIRIPEWARGQVLPSDLYAYTNTGGQWKVEGVQGQLTADGYYTIERVWKKGDEVRLHLDMPVRTVTANPTVAEDRGLVAIERGPLVYCAESFDNPQIDIRQVLVPREPSFTVVPAYGIRNTEGDGSTFSVTALRADVLTRQAGVGGQTVTATNSLTLIPYYAWCHRGVGLMDVWLPEVAHNPILPEFHADPEVLATNGRYYIYSTTDGAPGWGGYYFTCYSSSDLKQWQYEGVMFDVKRDTKWAKGNAWAPAIIEKNGKYYFYYSGDEGSRKAIGVAVSDSPTGPFTDLGRPLINQRPSGLKNGQQIDVDVFTDDDGQSYLYWGNGYMAGARLNGDMMSVDTTTIRLMTPSGGSMKDYQYREGPYVFKRKGVYYFLWSVDDTGSPNYHVAYGTSTSPLGPIEVARQPVVLIQRPDQQIYGPAHNSVLQVPGTDEWYIVYHRINSAYLDRENGPGFHREVCIDRLEFNADGTINPVIPTR